MSRHIVEVETKTFIRFWLVILGFAVLGFFLVKASEALAIIGIAALLAIAIRPFAQNVDKIIGKKSKSNLSSVLAYLIVILILAAGRTARTAFLFCHVSNLSYSCVLSLR